MNMCSVTQSCLTWTVAYQVLLVIEFPRQEYSRGLPFPTPGDLPEPEVEPVSPVLAGRLLTTAPPGKPREVIGDVNFSFQRIQFLSLLTLTLALAFSSFKK